MSDVKDAAASTEASPRSSRRRLVILVVLAVLVGIPCFLHLQHTSRDEHHLATERDRMVEEQLVTRGIRDERVLAAMRRVPRHLFVDSLLRPAAYFDRPLPIGHGQTISQPYIVALMTEVLQPFEGMKVFEVGTGSGYQAAVLAALGCRVFTIEIVPELARLGERNLRQAGFHDVRVRCGNGYNGWPEEAPFDAIIVTCAPEAIPRALVEQLKDEGKMVIPVGSQFVGQSLTLVRKTGGAIVTDEIIPVRFVPMVGGDERKGL